MTDVPAAEPDVGDETEFEESDALAPETDEGEEDEKPAPKPVDWEKRAHSHAGQAARERSRRQAAERRAGELESRLERLETRSGRPGVDDDELLALIAHLPDDDEDPVADIAAVKRALKLFRQREVGSVEESRQQQRATREVEGLKANMADAEADFSVEHPDYKEAAAWFRQTRAEELSEVGYAGEALMQKLADELFSMVRTAFSTGMDPAERVYELAKKRGFKAGQAEANKKLDVIDRAGSAGTRPQGRTGMNGTLSWGDVAKLDGPARDKAFEALRKREKAKK